MKTLNFLLLILMTININLFSKTNSNDFSLKNNLAEESKLTIKSHISTKKLIKSQLDQNTLIINERLKKRGALYRLNNEFIRGDCDFFDCEGQEACGFESWLGDDMCDDGTWGIYYNCDEFDNDNGDCDESGNDDGDSGGDGDGEVDPCIEIGGTTDWLGDGWCDATNNNNDCGYDAGDCCPSTCVDGQYDCLTYGGSCDDCIDPSAEDSNGAGSCTDTGDDGGSSDGGAECDFFDCEDQEACGFESWLGDGYCDDGTWGIYYNCDQYNNDDGDCDNTGDDGGDVNTCEEIGGTTDWLGDGWCDATNNNNDCGYDAGDCCPSTCVDGQHDCLTYGGSCDDCIDPSAEDSNGNGSCADTDTGDNEVQLSIGEPVGLQGEMPGEGILYGSHVPLYYESSQPIGGIQFTVSDSPNWVVGIEVSSVVSNCFDVSFNDVNGGLIAIFFSLDGCEIDATEDSIHFADITYELSFEAEWGSQVELNFQDVIISDGVGNTIPFNTQGGVMNVSLLGDVSSDSEINVIDIVTAINFILLIDEPSAYQSWAGDINEDGAINVLDIVMLIDIILGR